MSTLRAECSLCSELVTRAGADAPWTCPTHGEVVPFWRPDEVDYDALISHLALAGEVPTLLPWPPRPGWTVADFGVVAGSGAGAEATMTSVSGVSDADGDVRLQIVLEGIGLGLGGRVAGIGISDPGPEVGDGPPLTHLVVEGQRVALWQISTVGEDAVDSGVWDRSVLVGEWRGRWLWVTVKPASALLMFADEWHASDLAGLGTALVELRFDPHGGSAF